MSKKKEEDIERQIAHLEVLLKEKRHGKDSNELKLLSQLSVLYQKRNANKES